ncbi:hypothetical protein SDC9_111723 [bioreactor metagenome]|uniref:Uncharacterized protein n=1 Tax=bioreactor metagenome TaxID=1076179 RepID=A0A645BHU3_9ZZZZ
MDRLPVTVGTVIHRTHGRHDEERPPGGGEARFDFIHQVLTQIGAAVQSGRAVPPGLFQVAQLARFGLPERRKRTIVEVGAVEQDLPDIADGRNQDDFDAELLHDLPGFRQLVAALVAGTAGPFAVIVEEMYLFAVAPIEKGAVFMLFGEGGDFLRRSTGIGPHVAPFRGKVKDPAGIAPDLFGGVERFRWNRGQELEAVDAALQRRFHRLPVTFRSGAGLGAEGPDVRIAAHMSSGMEESPVHLRHVVGPEDDRCVFMAGRGFPERRRLQPGALPGEEKNEEGKFFADCRHRRSPSRRLIAGLSGTVPASAGRR